MLESGAKHIAADRSIRRHGHKRRAPDRRWAERASVCNMPQRGNGSTPWVRRFRRLMRRMGGYHGLSRLGWIIGEQEEIKIAR